MPWRLKEPQDQQAFYWPNKPEYSISSIKRVNKFAFQWVCPGLCIVHTYTECFCFTTYIYNAVYCWVCNNFIEMIRHLWLIWQVYIYLAPWHFHICWQKFHLGIIFHKEQMTLTTSIFAKLLIRHSHQPWYLMLHYYCCIIKSSYLSSTLFSHDDIIKWKHFPHYCPFVWGIHQSPVNSPQTGQWRGALMFSLICVLINGWVNSHGAGDLRCYRAHYGIIVMKMTWYVLWYSYFKLKWPITLTTHNEHIYRCWYVHHVQNMWYLWTYLYTVSISIVALQVYSLQEFIFKIT